MTLLLLITSFMMNFSVINEPDVSELRDLFYKAAVNKSSSQKMSKILDKVDDKSTPILLCYKGVSDMIQAKHVLNPISKLSMFNSGKTLIEEAIKRDPDDLEMRFLRFSIQSNLPGFLGYREDLSSDKLKLVNEIGSLEDEQLKRNIIEYLSSSKYCTEEELKKLKKWMKA
ncbi:MAG: hypothetical protein EOO92_10920 [Pedobacter sp.]|nr:MAG: hypothetical protein EOO92_10920 [Pedobacter sp.]